MTPRNILTILNALTAADARADDLERERDYAVARRQHWEAEACKENARADKAERERDEDTGWALEAREVAQALDGHDVPHGTEHGPYNLTGRVMRYAEMRRLEAAPAEVKPVAWQWSHDGDWQVQIEPTRSHAKAAAICNQAEEYEFRPLYTAPASDTARTVERLCAIIDELIDWNPTEISIHPQGGYSVRCEGLQQPTFYLFTKLIAALTEVRAAEGGRDE